LDESEQSCQAATAFSLNHKQKSLGLGVGRPLLSDPVVGLLAAGLLASWLHEPDACSAPRRVRARWSDAMAG
jgi:hypothetical protein